MSKSTKLVTATYILSYVAACAPELVTTDRIAEMVADHPTRVRQLVSSLVKHGLLNATRGGRGGVQLARPPGKITLREIQEAVQEQSLLALHLRDPVSEWAGKSKVHGLFVELQAELEGHISHYLDQHTLDQTYTPLIVPFAPGGTTDLLARTIGEVLNPGRRQPLLIEYRPAADGDHPFGTPAQLGGQPLVIATNSAIVAMAMSAHGASHLAGFVPVAQLTTTEMILAVPAQSPCDGIDELARIASRRAGAIRYASVGPGSMSHLAGEWLQRLIGARLRHCPYAGAQPAVTALLDGKVDLYFGTPPTILPHLRSGRLKALATTGRRRSTLLPEVPPLAERYPEFEVVGWQGVFAPASTTREQIRRLQKEISAALSSPQVRSRLRRQGFTISDATPTEFAAAVDVEIERWQERIRTLGIRLEPK